MMDGSFFLIWLTLMFPLCFSAGPANIMFASSGALSGFRKSIPFLVGINLVFFIYTVLFGLGASQILLSFPRIQTSLRFFGVGYMLYLALRFFRTALANTQNPQLRNTARNLRFRDGVILNMFNGKLLFMITLMYSQLISINDTEFLGIIILAFMTTTLNVLAGLSWILGGYSAELLFSRKASSLKIQNAIFGAMLVFVSLYVFFQK